MTNTFDTSTDHFLSLEAIFIALGYSLSQNFSMDYSIKINTYQPILFCIIYIVQHVIIVIIIYIINYHYSYQFVTLTTIIKYLLSAGPNLNI